MHDALHDRGLAFDLATLRERLLERRQVLRLAVGAGLLPLLGCAGDSSSDGCAKIPSEIAGPYPGDGSNGPNALTQSGIVRSDLRASFGSSTGTAPGIPLTLTLTLVNSDAACATLAGRAVYLWHCDREGRYSLYSSGVTNQNFLRGVQASDANGELTFTSIFPACYSGRWPHIHFEVFTNSAQATAGGNARVTSQLALPEAACNEVYATAGYESSVSNLRQVSLSSDNVFGDGSDSQLATVTGNVTDGYVAKLTVPVPG